MTQNNTNSPKLIAIAKSVLYWVLFVFLLFLFGSLLKPLLPGRWNPFAYGTAGTASALFVTWVMLKIERKSFSDYGLVWHNDSLPKFLKGFGIGTGIFIFILLLLLLFTDLQFKGNLEGWNSWSAFWYLAIIPLALMEEIAFRAYPFLTLNKVFGLRTTQITVALVFAFYHIIQGWNLQVAFLGPAVWALVFGLAAVWSNGIALPTGIHVALNVIQPLIGLKTGEYDSIWVLDLKENAAENAGTQADFVGLLAQLTVLVAAIFMTEFYIRKRMVAANGPNN